MPCFCVFVSPLFTTIPQLQQKIESAPQCTLQEATSPVWLKRLRLRSRKLIHFFPLTVRSSSVSPARSFAYPAHLHPRSPSVCSPPPPGSQSIFPDPSSSFIPPRHPGTPLKGFQCTIQHLHPRSPCSSSWRPPPRQPVHHHPFASSIPHRQKRPLPQPLAPPPSPLSPSSTLPSSPQRGRGAQCPLMAGIHTHFSTTPEKIRNPCVDPNPGGNISQQSCIDGADEGAIATGFR